MRNGEPSSPTATADPPAPAPAPWVSNPAALATARRAFREDPDFQEAIAAWAREARFLLEESSARRVDSRSSTE